MKKWIVKTEVTEILNMYSVRKDEFEAIEKEGFEYYYKNKFVKGYLIHISEEIKKGGTDKNDIKTGRIIVTHTKSSGKITFNDIWERNKEGKLEFLFRNIWNQPISDGEYIKDLNEDVEKMKGQYQKLISENKKLKDEIEKLRSIDSIKDNSDHLQEELKSLQQENQKLKNEKKYNARGAGRKPSQERLNSIEEVRRLLEAGTSDKDIQEQLGISKATFYRYKKHIRS